MPVNDGSVRIGLILVEMYPFYGAVLATETMRLANRYADRKVFDWTFISEDGRPVTASNGMSLEAEAAATIADLEYVLVIAGYDQDRRPLPRLKGLLRRLGRHGTVIGAVDSGAFLLAEAGVLCGHDPAVHFESGSSFRHRHPDVSVAERPIVISPKAMTCAGGALVIHLILAMIRERFGEVLASKVAADLHLAELALPRSDVTQAANQPVRLQLDDIVSLMEQTLDEPITLRELARRSGYSVRQLNRAFNERFKTSPMKHYQRLRLTHARELLYQGTQPVSEVALSCGFTALSTFSRAFKEEFGEAPTKLMATFRREGFSRIIPSGLQSAPFSLSTLRGVATQRRF